VLASAGLLAGIGSKCRAENRVILADQSDWSGNHGFYLDLENHGSNSPLDPSTITLYLGVANGSSWRFLPYTTSWKLNTSYTVQATITSTNATMSMNGKSVASAAGGFSPTTGLLTADNLPSWASDAATYVVVEDSLSVSVGGKTVINNTFPTRGAGVLAYLSNALARFNLSIPASATVVISTKFHLVATPDPSKLLPLMDAYFQNSYASGSWVVKKDSDLTAAQSKETSQFKTWGTPTVYDAYGGWLKAGWSQKATGYYTLIKHNGKWFLISPLGNPLFYVGVDTVPIGGTGVFTPVTGRANQFAWLPPTTGLYAYAWLTGPWGDGNTLYVDTTASNLIRKYGAKWNTQPTTDAQNRIKVLGFSGAGKWSATLPNVPYMPVLGRWSVSNVVSGGHPDIWDSKIVTALTNTLSQQIAPLKKDPNVVCLSMDNEISGIVLDPEITGILQLGATVPAKQALCNYGINTLYGGSIPKLATAWGITATTAAQVYASLPNPPDADIEALRQYYEGAYYALVRKIIKAQDSNHLYAGYWIVPGWWQNSADWTLNAKYCDVVGYDRYNYSYTDSDFQQLEKAGNKPVLCGEFSFPPVYQGGRGFGQYPVWANDDADAGALYQSWLNSAITDSYCVGLCWFEYRDEALGGRGPGSGAGLVYGEDYAFGIADGTDKLKWDLVTAMRTANLALPGKR
jgi:hypothetical protein